MNRTKTPQEEHVGQPVMTCAAIYHYFLATAGMIRKRYDTGRIFEIRLYGFCGANLSFRPVFK
jgi:hypothetical protein